jgi:glycosyltransferase involved in cell wall biosynthesis
MKRAITATIITLNEEKHIEAVIKSVQKVCDDIVVVDSLSSDKTVEIAKRLGANVIEQSYLGDGGQKAFCEQFAKYDWILSIDADERLDTNAIELLKTLDFENDTFDGYSFKRKSYVGDDYIKQWYPDRVVRLYNRKQCGYNDSKEHGKVETENFKKLDVDMLHYSFESYAQLVEKARRFVINLAHIRYNEGKRASWYDPFIHGVGAWFKGMIIKGGIFGGVHEWHIATVSAYNSYMKYVIMLELQKNEQ